MKSYKVTFRVFDECNGEYSGYDISRIVKASSKKEASQMAGDGLDEVLMGHMRPAGKTVNSSKPFEVVEV